MKPVGPEEPQVYWKRRALVVGVVLLALLILFLIFRPKGDDQPQAEPAITVSPSPTVSGSPAPTTTASGSASPSPSGPARECTDTDIEVTVSPDKPSYPAGVEPKITMAIANTGAFACRRDVGAGANEIVISSGGTQVWTSDDCSPSTESSVQTIEPGKSAAVTVTWPRTRSAAGCPTDQPPVAAGAYDVVGRNDRIDSEPVSLTLQ